MLFNSVLFVVVVFWCGEICYEVGDCLDLGVVYFCCQGMYYCLGIVIMFGYVVDVFVVDGVECFQLVFGVGGLLVG